MLVFVLIVTVIIPPWQPVVQNLEAYANLLFFCGLAWAWVSPLLQALLDFRAKYLRRTGSVRSTNIDRCHLYPGWLLYLMSGR